MKSNNYFTEVPCFYTMNASFNSSCLLDTPVFKQLNLFSKTIKYLEYGSSDNPPLVLLPGTGGDAQIFCRVLPALAEQHHVFAFSHIHVKGVKTVIQLWNKALQELIGSPFHLLGTSVGGWLVQHYAEQYPDTLQSVIIANSYADNTVLKAKNKKPALLARFLPSFLVKKILLKGIKASLEQYPESNIFIKYFEKNINQDTKRDLLIRVGWNLENLQSPQLASTLSKLLIISNDDPVIPKETRHHLIEYYPNAEKAFLNDAGHFPYLTKPNDYARIILEFTKNSNVK